jgi:hypothetical protein
MIPEQEELKQTAREANHSADRTIRKLNHTIAYVRRRLNKPRDSFACLPSGLPTEN